MGQLKSLAQRHGVKLHTKVQEGFFEDTVIRPGKRQYVNALAKVVRADKVKKELLAYKPPQVKRKKKEDDWSLF